MLTKRSLALYLLFFALFTGHAQTRHAKTSLFPSYKGLVMAGYQGWFRAEGDGSNSGFSHYFASEKKVGIDLWPDVSEYEKTYPTPFKLADGSAARLFSSYDKSTVDLHFKWMKDYGVDGVFMQRFFSGVRTPESRKRSSVVLQHALEASANNSRAIAVMYDLSGLRAAGEDCSAIIEDWKYLVDELKVTNRPGNKTYLCQGNKPVVAIWGIGFPDRPYNIRNIGLEKLINFLKNDPQYGGCAVMLGVPAFWRDLNADCIKDPYLHTILRKADIVLPWTVQRFTPLLHNDMDRYRDLLAGDMDWCRKNNLDYVPCITPGFSWHNLSTYEFPDDVKPSGSIPRQGGRFYWQQVSTTIQAGAQMVYVAMFDEVNEATAIFKTTDRPPVNVGDVQFIGMDGKPSDHYLWLTGEAGKMLRKEVPFSSKMPQRK
ncbi:glycoside hydrolase family 71/99-like protein [Hufsiella ginkgonis]|uniref:Xylosidase n=1 Tax=Hufsiella ginkgonis TaxID=2695274 RepID=A0A7K1Y308_9SPHI|nr:glycoside hydrolase family 71/99-like protein [Hufsiella ginkgonis]MXV17650.1 xylosidase [Hufsiella ginkgonis]